MAQNNNEISLGTMVTIAKKYGSGLSSEQTKNLNKIPEISASLESKATVVNFEKFITNPTDHTNDMKTALNYCKTNSKSLYIPDGNYYFSGAITINQEHFSFIGESRGVNFYISHSDYVFIVESHRTILRNFRIRPKASTDNYKYSGIHFKVSQCLLDNVKLDYVNEGIKYSTDSWCSNAKNINISYANKGVIFASGSGGNYIDFEIINGSAGYTNTQANGSVGITFEKGTGHHIIGDGGQISSFNYAFDFQGGADFRGSQVGKVYIEHNIDEFTPTSNGIFHTPHSTKLIY